MHPEATASDAAGATALSCFPEDALKPVPLQKGWREGNRMLLALLGGAAQYEA